MHMHTRWELVVALARELDADAANGAPDPTRAARLARTVLDFQSHLAAGANIAPSKPPTNGEQAG
jgi:hypothetical protein